MITASKEITYLGDSPDFGCPCQGNSSSQVPAKQHGSACANIDWNKLSKKIDWWQIGGTVVAGVITGLILGRIFSNNHG